MGKYIELTMEEYDELLLDKLRLDWLENQTNGDKWIARDSVFQRGFRVHNTSEACGEPTAREAIDATMNGARYRTNIYGDLFREDLPENKDSDE